MLPVNAWLAIWATTQALAVAVLLSMAATLYRDVQPPQREERPVPVAPATWDRPEIDCGLMLAVADGGKRRRHFTPAER